MKAFFKTLISTLLLLTSFTFINAQDLELIIHSKNSNNSSILKSISYQKLHKTKKEIQLEIETISKKLATIGYINNHYSLNNNDSTYACTYTLNKKVDSIRIYYTTQLINKDILQKITKNYTHTYFEVPIKNIENSLNYIVDYFENNGASFTTASLINISQQQNKLTTKLQLKISEKRKINTVVIKGYTDFPKKYLAHYLNIKQGSSFNSNVLSNTFELINTIPFVTQIKNPEVLFTKDSTTLFLYLKKREISNFDGIIGFSNEENSGNVVFNGYVDLNLNNTFNKGESFNLQWKNNGNNTQNLYLSFNTPYIFNTRFSTSEEFSILKQDSTFTTVKSKLNIGYNINGNNFIQATLSNENSNLTSSSNISNEIREFKNIYMGISYTYKTHLLTQYDYKPRFLLNFGFSIGNKTTKEQKETQNKVQLSASYTFNINNKNAIILKNTSELLNASNLLQNELFRIGGTNSIRGFDEQSIFTSKYSVTNIEYHYIINQDTHIYTVTDFAIFTDNLIDSTKKLYGIGLGYYFKTKNSILNLSYVTGKYNTLPFKLNNSKVHIKLTYPF